MLAAWPRCAMAGARWEGHMPNKGRITKQRASTLAQLLKRRVAPNMWDYWRKRICWSGRVSGTWTHGR